MLGKTEQRPRGRVEPKKQTQARIASAVKNAAVLTVTFDQPVVLRGTPAWTTDAPGSPTVVSAESPSPAVVEATFSATIAAATQLTIPVADAAVRTKVGGFVADTMFPLS